MSDKVTLQQLKPYLWNSANYLRNKIDAGDYKSYIFPLMFYKRICDVYDEEYQTSLSESNGDVSYALSPINHRFSRSQKILIGMIYAKLQKMLVRKYSVQ